MIGCAGRPAPSSAICTRCGTSTAPTHFFRGPGNPTGIVYQSYNQYHVDQYALFADGSFKITDEWKFSAGLRWYRYQTSQTQDEIGADAPTGIPNPTRTSASNNGYNPRFNLSYTPTVDLTTYASIAKGFRPGGANQILPIPNTPPLFCNSGAPTSFGSDSVWNYEIGEKARMFDNWLTINSDFYYIKWTGIQQTLLISCGYEYLDNAGNGRSFGPELEINAKLSDSWFVAATYTYTDAKLTEPNATFLNFLTTIAYNPNGTPYCASTSNCTAPIMNVPRDTASLAVTYTTKVFDKYQLTARVADNFIGTSYDEAFYFGFQLPSYRMSRSKVRLRASRSASVPFWAAVTSNPRKRSEAATASRRKSSSSTTSRVPSSGGITSAQHMAVNVVCEKSSSFV